MNFVHTFNNHQKKWTLKPYQKYRVVCGISEIRYIIPPLKVRSELTISNPISNPKYWLFSVLVGSNSVHVGEMRWYFLPEIFPFKIWWSNVMYISSRSRSSICQIHTKFQITGEGDLREWQKELAITILHASLYFCVDFRFTNGKFEIWMQ